MFSRVTQDPPSSTHFHPMFVVAFLVDCHCSIPNSVFEFVCRLVKILWPLTYARKTVVLGDSFNTENCFHVCFSKKITNSLNHSLIYNDSVLIRWAQTLWWPQETVSCIVVLKLMTVKNDWPGWFAYRPIYVKCNESSSNLFLYI